MAVSQIAVSGSGINVTGHYANGATVTVPVTNLTLAANDVLFIVASAYGNNTLANGDGTWTQLFNNATASGTFALWWKRTSGSETNPDITGASNTITVQVIQFRGVRTTGNPYDVISASPSTGTSASIDAASITLSTAEMVLQAFSMRDDNTPSSATLGNYDHVRSNAGTDCSCGFAWGEQASGATGTESVGESASDPWQTVLLALVEAPVAASRDQSDGALAGDGVDVALGAGTSISVDQADTAAASDAIDVALGSPAAGGNLAIEANVNGAATDATSAATSALTTAGASLIVVCVAAEPSGDYTGEPSSVSGAGLTFSKVAGGSNGNWVAGSTTYTATSSGAISGQTFTATFSQGEQARIVVSVLSFTGAHATQDGATLAVGTSASNLNRTISATYANSYIVAPCINNVANGGPTAGTGCTVVYNSSFYGYTVRNTDKTSAPGNFTLSTSGSSSGTVTSCAFEVREAEGSTEPTGAQVDSVYATDGAAPAKVVAADSTDTAAASDAAGVALATGTAASVDQADGAYATDAAAPAVARAAGATDTACANDALGVARAIAVGVTDTAAASDAEGVARAIAAATADGALVSDAGGVAKAVAAGSSDTAAATDAVAGVVASVGAVTGATEDSALASDAGAVAVVDALAATDTAAAGDSLAFALAYSAAVAIAETAAATDGAASGLAATLAQSDSAYALDAIGVALETSKVGASTDTAAASDAMAASMIPLALSATQSDGVYASEAVHARNSELTLPGPKPVRYWRDADLDQLRNAVMELWNDTFGDG